MKKLGVFHLHLFFFKKNENFILKQNLYKQLECCRKFVQDNILMINLDLDQMGITSQIIVDCQVKSISLIFQLPFLIKKGQIFVFN